MTRVSVLLMFLLFILTISNSYSINYSSLNKVYQKGVKAYSEDRWSECIGQFEDALHLYKLYKSIMLHCRNKCNSHGNKSTIVTSNEDLKIYEKFFNRKECLNQCCKKEFEQVHLKNDVDDITLTNMKNRKPYEYLHICYFQKNAVPKAASAAYTYSVVHLDDETMMDNVKFYMNQQEVDINEIVDMESENFENLYRMGLKSYENKNWKDTIASLDEAMNDYTLWENNCRLECEHQPPSASSSEFTITVSNNMASLLQCQQKCQEKLKALHYNSGIEFFADILNYLQMSYYSLQRYEEAARCVETYLKLIPDDEDQLENKKIYRTLVEEKAFTIRSDLDYYFTRDNDEKKLIHFFLEGNYVDIAYNSKN